MKSAIASTKHFYFLGIGGIGMSALARHLLHSGYMISGYDRDCTALTKKLEALGMNVTYEFNNSEVSSSIDTVIYTPAIKTDQAEYLYFHSLGVKMLKRSEALQELLTTKRVIAVAGTHGKTTTCALLSHLMYDSAAEITSIIGGIMANYDSNYLYGDSDWIIVEADEYDRSFLRLTPEVLVIQAMDADHLDVYKDEQDMINAYRQLTLQMIEGGTLWVEADLADAKIDAMWRAELDNRKIKLRTFGVEGGSIHAVDITAADGITSFATSRDTESYVLSLPGRHNLQNAVAALAVSYDHGIKHDKLRAAMEKFSGVQRRFEYIYRSDDVIIINDYAHHPVEIKAAIATAREHHPSRMLTVVFQPHLYSRTRDFLKGFAAALSHADETILVELYPAREKPIEGINSEKILSLLTNDRKAYVPKSEVVEYLIKGHRQLLLLLGAGDLYKYQEELCEKIRIQNNKD